MDGEAWWAAVHGVARVGHDWATSLSLSCTGEGNGNPLQCSCLENPKDGRAWWAAVYGVAQSQTQLRRLSSSSSSRSEAQVITIDLWLASDVEKRQSCEIEPSTHECDATSKFIVSELCWMVGHPVSVQELLGSAWETQNKKVMYRMEEDICRFTFILTSVRNQKEAANIGAGWFSSRALVCGHLTLSLPSCNCIKADSLYCRGNMGSFNQLPCFSHLQTLCYSFNSGFCLVELSLEISLTSFSPSSSYPIKSMFFPKPWYFLV